MSRILIFLALLLSAVLYTKYQFGNEKLTIKTDVDHSFEIYRDNKGVPHIFAHEIEDTLFGLGYAEA